MRARWLIGVGLSLSLLLAGCAASSQPRITPKKTQEIAAANRQSDANAAAKAQDASAKKATGTQLQATNDHLTSPTMAAAAVKQVLKAPAGQLFRPVPTINSDARGHHYYQVDAFQRKANGQQGHLLKTYFVYPNGTITTKQAD